MLQLFLCEPIHEQNLVMYKSILCEPMHEPKPTVDIVCPHISYMIGLTSGAARHRYCAVLYILPDWSD